MSLESTLRLRDELQRVVQEMEIETMNATSRKREQKALENEVAALECNILACQSQLLVPSELKRSDSSPFHQPLSRL